MPSLQHHRAKPGLSTVAALSLQSADGLRLGRREPVSGLATRSCGTGSLASGYGGYYVALRSCLAAPVAPPYSRGLSKNYKSCVNQVTTWLGYPEYDHPVGQAVEAGILPA